MPPDEAYGRVTDPGRFRVLHEVADRAVGRLAASYDVQVRAAATVAEDFPGRPPAAGIVRILELVPADDTAAPVTIVFTDFPGLVVRYGRWHVEAYPVCGCDACDEIPDELGAALVSELTLLAEHGLHETLARSRRDLHTSYEFPGRRAGSRGWVLDDPAGADAWGEPGRRDWRPWPVRTSATDGP
jgi:hypothetical protein